jgi:predicted enzyme related to lactoylglutathione lyase
MAKPAKRLDFECCNPILRVEDIGRSLGFYVDNLGFTNAAWGNEDFTSISRDGASIYLCRGGQGKGGAWVWLGVGDAEALHHHLQSRGVKIRMEPKNFPWALEFHVEDPDGNVLRVGSEPTRDGGFEER